MKFADHMKESQLGMSMIEVLFGVAVFAIIGILIVRSATYSMRFQRNAEISCLARDLAVTKAEELTGVALVSLDSSDNSTESEVFADGYDIPFTRNTTITVNADGSRTIVVSVDSVNESLLSPITYSTTLALWAS